MIVRVELSTMFHCIVCDTVVMFGEDVWCSVVFDTLVGVFVFSVIWFWVADDICYQLSSVVISVRVPGSGVCIRISGED